MSSKTCPRCQRTLPQAAFYLTKGKPDVYCSACRREVARQRRAETREVDNARRRERYRQRLQDQKWAAAERERKRRVMAEIRARDPERVREQQRFYYWKARELDHERTPPAGTRQHYRAPSKLEVVPAAPLVAFLESVFVDETQLAEALKHAVSAKGANRLLVGRQERIALDFADRILTKGLGRPDLLNVLYPLGGDTHEP